jgi:hypothetical protein
MNIALCIVAAFQSIWCSNVQGWCREQSCGGGLQKTDGRKLNELIWLGALTNSVV